MKYLIAKANTTDDYVEEHFVVVAVSETLKEAPAKRKALVAKFKQDDDELVWTEYESPDFALMDKDQLIAQFPKVAAQFETEVLGDGEWTEAEHELSIGEMDEARGECHFMQCDEHHAYFTAYLKNTPYKLESPPITAL